MNAKWNNRMLALATEVASWSKDPSTQVGAVITDSMHRVISMGYNGPPRGVVDVPTSRDEKLRRTIHAEKNAILFAHQSLMGCTIYVTHPCCAQCAAMVIQAGIYRVVHTDRPLSSDWAPDLQSAAEMFRQASVVVESVPRIPDPRAVWLSIAERANVTVGKDGKRLHLSEEMCELMGTALGL